MTLIAPVCAVTSSLARGLTNYGDGILFHICAACLRVASGVPAADEAAELQFAVLCTGIMSLTSIPLAIYLARAQLQRMAPYGVTMAVSGLAMVPAGTAALFSGDTRVLEFFVALFFIAFACVGLTNAVFVAAMPNATAAPNAAAPASAFEFAPAFDTRLSPPNSDVSVLPPRSLPFNSPLDRFTHWADATLPPVSPIYSPTKAMGILFSTGTASGFLGALMGTGGPPQMAAFAFLETPKDDVRAIATIYSIIELPLRLALWIGSAAGKGVQTGAWAPERDGGLYAAVAVASAVGFVIGAFLRKYADTSTVSNAMLVLIALGASVLLGAVRSAAIAALCAAGALAFAAFLTFVWSNPQRYKDLTIHCRRGNKTALQPVQDKPTLETETPLTDNSDVVEAQTRDANVSFSRKNEPM